MILFINSSYSPNTIKLTNLRVNQNRTYALTENQNVHPLGFVLWNTLIRKSKGSFEQKLQVELGS